MPSAIKTSQQYYTPMNLMQTQSGGIVRQDINRVGMYARLWLNIRGIINTVSGSVDPRGIAAIIKRVKVESNFTSAIFDVSGVGFNHLLRPNLGQGVDMFPQNNGLNAIDAATIVNLDMVVPFCVNLRDMVGVLVGGNPSSLFTLEIEREVDSVLGVTAWTEQPTIQPILEWFTVPENPADRPPTDILHRILEERRPVAATGDFVHDWPIGGTVLGHYYGYGLGEIDTPSAIDNFDRVDVRVNQVNYLHQNADPAYWDVLHAAYRGQERVPGTFFLDMLGSAGLGDYDTIRDAIQTLAITEGQTKVHATDTDTFYAMRRELIPLAMPR